MGVACFRRRLTRFDQRPRFGEIDCPFADIPCPAADSGAIRLGAPPQWPGFGYRGAGAGSVDQYVRIPFEIELERSPEVDVREMRRADSPQPVLFNLDAVTPEGEWPILWASPMRADEPSEGAQIACLAGTSA